MAKKLLKKLLARVSVLEKAIAQMLSSHASGSKKRKKARKAKSKKTSKPARKIRTAKGRKKPSAAPHPGMMGDGTEEQNLGQGGRAGARIKKAEVAAAFGNVRK